MTGRIENYKGHDRGPVKTEMNGVRKSTANNSRQKRTDEREQQRTADRNRTGQDRLQIKGHDRG